MTAVSVWSLLTGHELSRQPSIYPYLVLAQTIASLPAIQGSPGVMQPGDPDAGLTKNGFTLSSVDRVRCGASFGSGQISSSIFSSKAFLPISPKLGVLDRGGHLVLPSLLLLLLLLLPLLLSP